MTIASNGIIAAARTKAKITFLKRKSKTAKAKPAAALTTTPTTIVVIATKSELPTARGKPVPSSEV